MWGQFNPHTPEPKNVGSPYWQVNSYFSTMEDNSIPTEKCHFVGSPQFVPTLAGKGVLRIIQPPLYTTIVANRVYHALSLFNVGRIRVTLELQFYWNHVGLKNTL